MAPVFKTFEFDTGTIDEDIEEGKTNPNEIRGHIGRVIDNLVRGKCEALKGSDTANGYPESILVGGKDKEQIQGAYKDAIRGTPLGDYTLPGKGKTYTK